MFLKSDVCQHFAAIKAGKRHFVYKFLIQNIVSCIQKDVCQLLVEFKPKAGKHPPGQNVGKHLPPNLGGLSVQKKISYFETKNYFLEKRYTPEYKTKYIF